MNTHILGVYTRLSCIVLHPCSFQLVSVLWGFSVTHLSCFRETLFLGSGLSVGLSVQVVSLLTGLSVNFHVWSRIQIPNAFDPFVEAAAEDSGAVNASTFLIQASMVKKEHIKTHGFWACQDAVPLTAYTTTTLAIKD